MWSSVVLPALSSPRKSSLPDFFHKPAYNTPVLITHLHSLQNEDEGVLALGKLITGRINYSSNKTLIKVDFPDPDNPKYAKCPLRFSIPT